jgi:outer membrane protein OmpA-like peptidoglycan-associated protein
MTATTFDGSTFDGLPRPSTQDAWRELNRRYSLGTAALVALLLVLWAIGSGPGATWRAAAPDAGIAPQASTPPKPAGVTPGAADPSASRAAPGAATATAPSAATGGAAAGGTAAGTAKPDAAARSTTPPASAAPATPRPVAGAPVARLYFEPDQAWPSGELGPRLAPVLARLKAEPDTKALVSGFHDRRGSTERNATLALRRAESVRRVLIREGIAADRIVLAKPQRTTGSGSDREARRVEVTVAR